MSARIAAAIGLALIMTAPLSAASPPKQLEIVEAQFQQYEDGPPVTKDYAYIAGETMFFSFRVRGYALSDENKLNLQYQLDAFDYRGMRLIETVKKTIDTSVSAEDKNWTPKAQQTVQVPPLAESGDYKIVISVQDLPGKTAAKQEFAFRVRGRVVEPSDTLVLRGFRFLRQEDDKDPLKIPAYKPGDTVWARFEITGYKFGPKNLIHVEYTLSVAGSDGKVLFSQPQPAVVEDSPFYPNQYVPGVVSLTTNQETGAGDYFLVISVKDQVSNQTYEAREKFAMQK